MSGHAFSGQRTRIVVALNVSNDYHKIVVLIQEVLLIADKGCIIIHSLTCQASPSTEELKGTSASDNMIILSSNQWTEQCEGMHSSSLTSARTHKTNFCGDTKLSTRHHSRLPLHKTNFCSDTKDNSLWFSASYW